MARIAKLAADLASEAFSLAAEAHEAGYSLEQVGVVASAFEAISRASARAAFSLEAHEAGYSSEQVGVVASAFEAIGRASARAERAREVLRGR